jgi:hypothetical protein
MNLLTPSFAQRSEIIKILNKIIHLSLSALIIMLCIPITPIQAAEKITVTEISTAIQFPSTLNFNIKATSDSAIVKMRLQYQVEKMNFTTVISEAWPEFTSSTQVDTKWTWDMRTNSLPPFASVKYWWIIENKNGDKVTSPVKTVIFSDTRYSWQETTSGNLHLNWYEGNTTFAAELIKAGEEALKRLNQDTGATLDKQVYIYIYANTDDLQKAMVNPREWTGGAAFYEYSIIAIGVSQRNLEWGKTAIAHELGHLFTHQSTFGPYGAMLPTWIDEGLAMHAEGKMDKDAYNYLLRSHQQNKLFSLQSLSSPFSAKTNEALLSYAESQSAIEFLIQSYGKNNMAKLLNLFQEGTDTDSALKSIYGFNQDGLETKWKDSLKTLITQPQREQPNPIFVSLLAAFLTIIAVLLAFGLQDLYWRKANKPKSI